MKRAGTVLFAVLVGWLAGASTGCCDDGERDQAKRLHSTSRVAAVTPQPGSAPAADSGGEASDQDPSADLGQRLQTLSEHFQSLRETSGVWQRELRQLRNQHAVAQQELDRLREGASRELEALKASRLAALQELKQAQARNRELEVRASRDLSCGETPTDTPPGPAVPVPDPVPTMASMQSPECDQSALGADLALVQSRYHTLEALLVESRMAHAKTLKELAASRKLVANLTARLERNDSQLNSLYDQVGTLREHLDAGQLEQERLASEKARVEEALQAVEDRPRNRLSAPPAEAPVAESGEELVAGEDAMSGPGVGWHAEGATEGTGGLPEQGACAAEYAQLASQQAYIGQLMAGLGSATAMAGNLRGYNLALQQQLYRARQCQAKGMAWNRRLTQELDLLQQENAVLRAQLGMPRY